MPPRKAWDRNIRQGEKKDRGKRKIEMVIVIVSAPPSQSSLSPAGLSQACLVLLLDLPFFFFSLPLAFWTPSLVAASRRILGNYIELGSTSRRRLEL